MRNHVVLLLERALYAVLPHHDLQVANPATLLQAAGLAGVRQLAAEDHLAVVLTGQTMFRPDFVDQRKFGHGLRIEAAVRIADMTHRHVAVIEGGAARGRERVTAEPHGNW